jgi:hypothetical protein
MFEFFKKHYGKIFAGTTGTIVFTVAGVFFSDYRYAHAKTVREDAALIQQQIDELKIQVYQLELAASAAEK